MTKWFLGALLCMTVLLPARQGYGVIAYDAPLQPGNQAFTGNLGLDFDVTSPIRITALGVFDSAGDGLVGSIAIAIFNRLTTAQVGSNVTFIPGTGATLVNGDRISILPPGFDFDLPAGMYSIVAVGFGAADLNGNSTVGGPYIPSTEDTGGGLISFVGTGRYDANTTLDFPTIVPPAVPSNVFLAGTFEFVADLPATISKTFAQPTIPLGSSTTLTFTVTNPNPSLVMNGVAFIDTLPSGLLVATPNGLTGSCGGGTITATAGSGVISLSGATLAAKSSCTFSVDVAAVGIGVQKNVTSTVTSTNGAPGVATATASITVFAATPVLQPSVLLGLVLLLAAVAWLSLRKVSRVKGVEYPH